MKKVIAVLFLVFAVSNAFTQKSSFIFLGDVHYDKLEYHDMDWLAGKPDDLRQVTTEYAVYTEKFWNDFMSVLKQRIQNTRPEIKAVVQAGDISEGLAGTPEKAKEMAEGTMKALEEAGLGVPWILAKGNHDITGPGAQEAFTGVYIPELRKQTGNDRITSASYSYRYGNVQIVCLDPWERSFDMASFLEKEFASSDAKFRFVVIHEPVIPVTERCWHTLRTEPQKREKLLEVIAKNKAVVLCAHLHRYSVVARNTQWGPVVQVMAVSVVKDRNYVVPDKLITEYGPSLAVNHPEWEPATLEARKKILAEEAKYVTYYKQSDLPGYAIITTDDKKGTVTLKYYAAFGKKPYDTVNLTGLLRD